MPEPEPPPRKFVTRAGFDKPWRERLVPASFRGIKFHVESAVTVRGRRIAVHEYPKRDTPYSEDMGRHTRRFNIQAYLLGANYDANRDLLQDALELEGAGMLTVYQVAAHAWRLNVVVEEFSITEQRERGGFCMFEMRFVEVGTPANEVAFAQTQAVITDRARELENAAVDASNKALAAP
jgi:prophage DNA circulation protein